MAKPPPRRALASRALPSNELIAPRRTLYAALFAAASVVLGLAVAWMLLTGNRDASGAWVWWLLPVVPLACAVLAVRASRLSVTVTERGVIVRDLTRTSTIAIDTIKGVGLVHYDGALWSSRLPDALQPASAWHTPYLGRTGDWQVVRLSLLAGPKPDADAQVADLKAALTRVGWTPPNEWRVARRKRTP